MTTAAPTLDDVIGALPTAELVPGAGSGATAVTSVTHDSRQVTDGALFAAIVGSASDGHSHAPAAVAAGARALLVERRLDLDVPQIVVPSVRAAIGPASSTVHGHPSASLRVVGITGTNGKTTTVSLVAAILDAHGWNTLQIGTLTGERTTPEAPELQAALANHRDIGGDAVVMEVSSHALAMGRVDGTRFSVAGFTNLGRDHLDFHGDAEAYFEAKASLFTTTHTERAVVWAATEAGQRIVEQCWAADLPTTVVTDGDAGHLQLEADSATFDWRGEGVTLALPGRHNLANALLAAAIAEALDVSPSTVARGLSTAPPVPGRFERIDRGQPFTVIIDYAHTPDAIAAAISAARHFVSGDGRVIVVFGAGGERDPTKRAPMGEATAGADLVIITSDNPRREDPATIAAAVASGVPDSIDRVIELDRRTAIHHALEAAATGDVVVVCGKGHETTQEREGRTEPFDDRVVAFELLGVIVGGEA
ncbi:MAG TPA: UDP-N-acetylmuramoyl-L-alanyl-D-glutamate--2,6-diaminopimelate ligase [Acidimicrobiales bacterium]